MFELMLFLHLAGLVLWFGSSMAKMPVILLVRRQAASVDIKTFASKAIRAFGWSSHASSILVLISGIIMIIQMDFGDSDKPLWLLYMERGGGIIILAAVVLTAIFGKKMINRLGQEERTGSAGRAAGNAYLLSIAIILAAVLSVVLVVSLRL